MSRPVDRFAVLLLAGLMAFRVHAEPPPVVPAGSGAVAGTTTANGADARLPTLEMLEFLGDWESDDGEWLGPEGDGLMTDASGHHSNRMVRGR